MINRMLCHTPADPSSSLSDPNRHILIGEVSLSAPTKGRSLRRPRPPPKSPPSLQHPSPAMLSATNAEKCWQQLSRLMVSAGETPAVICAYSWGTKWICNSPWNLLVMALVRSPSALRLLCRREPQEYCDSLRIWGGMSLSYTQAVPSEMRGNCRCSASLKVRFLNTSSWTHACVQIADPFGKQRSKHCRVLLIWSQGM